VQCRAQGLVIDGLVEDLSRSGMFVHTPRTIGLWSEVEIDIDLPGEQTLHLSGEVVRLQAAPRSGMGLRLVGEGSQSRRSLANFIMRQHAVSR